MSRHSVPTMKGFLVRVVLHTEDARKKLSDPERVRFIVGEAFDSRKLAEEVDYTLEVARFWGGESTT